MGGNSTYLQYWKKKIKSNNIFFLGFKDQLYCNILRQKFNILIAPYQNKVYVHGSLHQDNKKKKTIETSLWMSPLKIFEYMAAKKPIITSKLEAISQILTNNHDAILCNPQNFNEWKKAIEKLNKDKNFAKKISKNAYNKFKDKFTWHIRTMNILEEFKRLNITIFNFSLSGGGTEYMLSVLYNKLNNLKNYRVYLAVCHRGGHYIKNILNKKNLFFFDKYRVIFTIFTLSNFIKNTQSKILFTSMMHTNVVAIFLKLFFNRNLKVIIRESNMISLKSHYENSSKSRIINWLAKKLYNKADAIIAPTNAIKNDLINNYNVNSTLIYKIQNPYDFNQIERLSNKLPNKKEKKLIQKPYLLSIGRLHIQKNFCFLIEAFKHVILNQNFKNLKLYILGDGKQKKFLKDKIKFLNLRNNVSLLGFQKNPFIFMKKSKLFLLTSLYEGHSNVLVQAQYLKNKIIASTAGGTNREVLISNGIIYKSSNPKKVANLIIKILLNNIKDKKIVLKNKLKQKFDGKVIISKYKKIFNSF